MEPELEEAIKKAICKWEELCAGLRPVRAALCFCSLCNYLEGATGSGISPDACNTFCPLAKAGYNCLETDSVWFKIDEQVGQDSWKPMMSLKFLKRRHINLINWYEEIYNALCSLLPDYDPYL